MDISTSQYGAIITDTKVLVLAGGFGTRLRPKVSDLPKSMAPVAGKPFLEWQLMMLRSQGFTHIVLCVGYLAKSIIDYFGDGSGLGMHIDYSVEKEPLGTAGAIRNAAKYIDGTFIFLNGDTYFEADYRRFLDFHNAKGAILSLSLVISEDASRYGAVRTDTDNRVVSFKEKAEDIHETGYINAGVYIAEPSLLEYIAPNQTFSLENNVIPTIISNTGLVFGFVSDSYFIDIGTPESYEQAQQYFAR